MRNQKGFTLIELMIVVAIIGILAAIAIPSFLAMQNRSKRAEVPTNLKALRTSEKGYQAEYDTFVDCAAQPAAPGVGIKQAFGAPNAGFAQIGWVPDGQVYGSYQVTGATAVVFQCEGSSDIDGDGTPAVYQCDQDNMPSRTTNNDIY